MPRLSIVILALGRTHTWEHGLVSVLENRPAGGEVLVVLNRPYENPYRLDDEVRFVSAPQGARLAEMANLGVHASRAAIVHVLRAGVEVREGWADLALRHFVDPQVAAVAPTVLDIDNRRQVLSAGLSYSAGGGRRTRHTGKAVEALLALPQAVLGPSATAAFYRRDAFEHCGGFEPSLGDRLCDVDLALRLTALGLRSVFDPAVHVYSPGEMLASGTGYQAGRQAARLFWRAAPLVGWLKALAGRLPALAWRFLSGLPSPAACSTLAGELAGTSELYTCQAHYRRLRELRGSVATMSGAERAADSVAPIEGPHFGRPLRTARVSRPSPVE